MLYAKHPILRFRCNQCNNNIKRVRDSIGQDKPCHKCGGSIRCVSGKEKVEAKVIYKNLSNNKPFEREKAKELRANGKSIKAIAKELNVSQGSVSSWVKNVPLSNEQKQTLIDSCHSDNVRQKAKHTFINNYRNRRLDFQKKGRILARDNNQLHLIGCMLYWAEGAKDRNIINFVNTDINMILLFLKFLYECYEIDKKEIKCKVGSVPEQRIKKAEQFWSLTTGISLESFQKALIDKREKTVGKYARKHKHVFGTLTIIVNRTDIVQSIFGAIQEYGNFVKHSWVDQK